MAFLDLIRDQSNNFPFGSKITNFALGGQSKGSQAVNTKNILNRRGLDALNDPAFNWRWHIYAPILQADPKLAKGVVIESITVPQPVIEANQRYSKGSFQKFPSYYNIDAASIAFYEDEAYNTTAYLQNWLNLIVDGNSNYGVPNGPNGYKKEFEMNLFNQYDTSKAVAQWILRGCWPAGTDPLSYSYGEEGRIIVNCNFSVDRIEFVHPNVNNGPNGG